MRTASEVFGAERALVGMVHLGALPGTPHAAEGLDQIVARAVFEACLLAEGGFDALLLENMHDAPYLMRDVGPEIVSAMTAAAVAVRAAVDLPVGIQVLAGANRQAVAIAHAAGCGFVRAEGFVFASVADEGLMETADAGPLLRYRRSIGADDVAILADVKKKHSAHAITADVDLAQTVHGAEFFGADGVIVTGTRTGEAVAPNDLARCRSATQLPVVVGSGATPDTLRPLFELADAIIVGSWYKREGSWANEPDPARVAALVAAARAARGG